MPSHELIDAYVARLARRLPADAVDELTDGLTETYRHHLASTTDSQAAARRALAEFGTLEEVTTAFTVQSPGRRTARILLATGPAMGTAWGTALVVSHAWQWPVPATGRLLFGGLLVAVVAALAVAATGRSHYARTRRAVLAGGIGMLALDGAAVVGVALVAPMLAWPVAIAATASATRIGLTARALPRIVSS